MLKFVQRVVDEWAGLKAQDQALDYVSAIGQVSAVERSLLVAQQERSINAIARRDTGELIGIELLTADDLIHEAAMALRERLRTSAIAATIHACPTFSQGLRQVMEQLADKLHKNTAGAGCTKLQ